MTIAPKHALRLAMAVSRPLSKALLKKLFLKTRFEMRRGGKLSGRSTSLGGIIATIPNLFPQIAGGLTRDEEQEAKRAAYELERDGFIQQEIGQSDSFKLLSKRGEQVAAEDLDKMQLSSIDINELLSNERLCDKIRDDYIVGDFETAVFKAFKMLEEEVRAKSGEPPASIGVSLMCAAFSPSTGKLKHPGAAIPQEQEGLHHLMRGAIAWFKNPSSHRTVPRDDPQQAAHVLAFANMLLDLLDECV